MVTSDAVPSNARTAERLTVAALDVTVGVAREPALFARMDRGVARPRPAAEAGLPVVVHRALDLVARVHDERAVLRDRLADGLALEHEDLDLGVSGLELHRAIAKGENDPAVLAGMADGNLRASAKQLEDALSTSRNLHPVARQMIGMVLDDVEMKEKDMLALEKSAAELMRAQQREIERNDELAAKR